MATDWFEWNGVKSTAYGIHVAEHPPITIPKARTSSVTVPGKSGTLTITEGTAVYDDVTLSCECFVADSTRIQEIAAWLSGTGTLTFANRPDGYYMARVSSTVPFDKVVRGRKNLTLKISFSCHPFFYISSGLTSVTFTAPDASTLNNTYGFDAYPLIKVVGKGSSQIMIGDYSILLDGIQDNITIDTEYFYAYRTLADGSTQNACSCVTLIDDEWPVLEPGLNPVNWSPTTPTSANAVTSVTITPNWRCL